MFAPRAALHTPTRIMYGQTRIAARQRICKRPHDAEDGRLKRTRGRNRLRARQRAEQMQRRRLHEAPTMFFTREMMEEGAATLPELAGVLECGNADAQHQAVRYVRELVSLEDFSANDAVLAAGLVPHIVRLLSSRNAGAAFDAAWILTNLAAGDSPHCAAILDAGGGTQLVECLSAVNTSLREQAAWALSNLAAESTETRDALLKEGAVPLLLACTNSTRKLRSLALQAVANLCRNAPSPAAEYTAPILRHVAPLLSTEDPHAVWCIAHISNNEHLSRALKRSHRIAPQAAQLLAHRDPAIVQPALRIIGNSILDPEVIAHVVDVDFLSCVGDVMQHIDTPHVCSDACWLLSNVAAGAPQYAQMLIDAGLLPLLIAHLDHPAHSVRHDAVWAIGNTMSHESPWLICPIAEAGGLPPFYQFLRSADPTLVLVTLRGIHCILSALDSFEHPRAFLETLVCNDVGAALERLHDHQNDVVVEWATDVASRLQNALRT